jgi:hypothetical protein
LNVVYSASFDGYRSWLLVEMFAWVQGQLAVHRYGRASDCVREV